MSSGVRAQSPNTRPIKINAIIIPPWLFGIVGDDVSADADNRSLDLCVDPHQTLESFWPRNFVGLAL